MNTVLCLSVGYRNPPIDVIEGFDRSDQKAICFVSKRGKELKVIARLYDWLEALEKINGLAGQGHTITGPFIARPAVIR